MIGKNKPSVRVITATVVSCAAVTLAGCSQQVPTNLPAFGHASPDNVTTAPTAGQPGPAGDAITVPAKLSAAIGSSLSDIDAIGSVVAIRGDKGLAVGSVDQLRNGTIHTVPLDSACGPTSTGHGVFTLACPKGQNGIGSEGSVVRVTPAGDVTVTAVPFPATAAVTMPNGDIVAVSSHSKDVIRLTAEGSPVTSFTLPDPSDQLISVPTSNGREALVSADSTTTKMSGIETDKKDATYLRIGRGVGRIEPADDALMLVTDTVGNQLLVYTASPIIMLHQSAVTGPKPWAVTWDKHNHVAWVSTTGDNTISAWSINTGVPVRHGEFTSDPGVRGMALVDGQLVTVSTNATIRVINAADVNSAATSPAQPPLPGEVPPQVTQSTQQKPAS